MADIRSLAFGLLAIMLMAGCSDDDSRTECEISCSDGFHTTRDGSCDISASLGLAIAHGSCTQSEHW